MDAPLPFWQARRAMIAGCESSLGAVVAGQLLARSADVAIQVSRRPEPDSLIVQNHEKYDWIRCHADDRASISMALSVRESELLVLAEPFPPLVVHSMISSARRSVPMAAVVVVVNSLASRSVAVAEAFRAAGGNPVGVVFVPVHADVESAAEFLVIHAERVIRRVPAALCGVATAPSYRRQVA
ncbi:MAG: hypothetical protein U0798_03015 [Gemmataceae bacterium]